MAAPASLSARVDPVGNQANTASPRNLLRDSGRSQTDIDAKVNAAYNYYFTDSDSNKRITRDYAPGGYSTDSNGVRYAREVYMLDPAPGVNAVRSEGMSYGMLIAVMLNKRRNFDQLWRFTNTRMMQQSGPRQYFTCWTWSPSSEKCTDVNPAPDGDIYIAAALYLAKRRGWGNSTAGSSFNFKEMADKITTAMVTPKASNPEGVTAMFGTNNLVVFTPIGTAATFSDPSYHLPHFFELFRRDAPTTALATRWQQIRDASRSYLNTVATRNSTCLSPDYANFDGSPYVTSGRVPGSDLYAYDAWRVINNVGLDYYWWTGNANQITQANCLLNFFRASPRGFDSSPYKHIYSLSGSDTSIGSAGNFSRNGGQAGMNAAGALAAQDTSSGNWPYLYANDLWDQPIPSGEYRYYSGLLYTMGLVATSGKYRYTF